MNRYKVKFESVRHYEMEVNANGGYEAAKIAEKCPDQWIPVEYDENSIWKSGDRCIGASLMKEGVRE